MLSSQYYIKYRKYKQKYLKLKQQGGEPFTDINLNLYIKFITEKLVALLPIEMSGGNKKRKNEIPEDEVEFDRVPEIKTSRFPTRIRNKPSYLQDYVQDLTPQILRYLTPVSKARMEVDIEIDNDIIEKLKAIQEQEDPAYTAYENYGKLIECWIADNMICPCCGENQTLRRYLSDSMPVIDLVCINPLHTLEHGVKFFQVKTSNGRYFLDKPYFMYDATNTNRNANTIHVGSRRWGEPVHSIRPRDSLLNKKILCGYICIGYTDNDTTISINLRNSFIVLPEYLLTGVAAKRSLSFESSEVVSPEVKVRDDKSWDDKSWDDKSWDDKSWDDKSWDDKSWDDKSWDDKSWDDKSWYYRYIEPNRKHQRIEFNINTNKIIVNDDIRKLIPRQTIDKSYVIKTDSMPNPLSILE